MISGFPRGNKASWARGFLSGTCATAFSQPSPPGERMMKSRSPLLKKGCRLREKYESCRVCARRLPSYSWASHRDEKKRKRKGKMKKKMGM